MIFVKIGCEQLLVEASIKEILVFSSHHRSHLQNWPKVCDFGSAKFQERDQKKRIFLGSVWLVGGFWFSMSRAPHFELKEEKKTWHVLSLVGRRPSDQNIPPRPILFVVWLLAVLAFIFGLLRFFLVLLVLLVFLVFLVLLCSSAALEGSNMRLTGSCCNPCGRGKYVWVQSSKNIQIQLILQILVGSPNRNPYHSRSLRQSISFLAFIFEPSTAYLSPRSHKEQVNPKSVFTNSLTTAWDALQPLSHFMSQQTWTSRTKPWHHPLCLLTYRFWNRTSPFLPFLPCLPCPLPPLQNRHRMPKKSANMRLTLLCYTKVAEEKLLCEWSLNCLNDVVFILPSLNRSLGL